jgi:zinc protease
MKPPCNRFLLRGLVLLLATSLGYAQSAATQTAPQPRKPDPVVVRNTGPLPSWKDLHFPPLGQVKIPHPEVYSLSNGMKVYLLEHHELPLVSGRLLVRTGNLFDPKAKLGLAEITGITMRSGGTSKLTGDQLDERLEDMAASVETGIGESSGSASFSCLKENTAAVLQLFYAVVTDPAFREDKIDLAKTQIKSSISRRNDDASGIADRELYRLLYGPHTPYGDEVEYDTINAIHRDDITGFYKRYFFPSNMILAVYGDFDSATVKRQLQSLFGSWKAEEPKTPPFPKVDAPPQPGIFLVTKTDVTQTFVQMGHLGGELRNKDFPALSVAADVFGGGFSSRLFREVRTRLGYAYAVGADWAANYDHPGLFRISVSTKSQTTTETIEAILKQLTRMRTSEITDEELKVAKDSVLNSLVFAFARPSSTLNRLVTYDYFNYPADFLTQYENAIKGVTRADVLRVSKQYFQPSELTIVAVGNPTKFGEPLTALNLPVKPLDVSIPPPHEETAQADAQSIAQGKQLLDKAFAFMGGAQKLAALQDITETANAKMETPQGELSLQIASKGILPGTFREEQQRGPANITIFVSPGEAWINTPQGVKDLPEPAAQQIREQVARQLPVLMSHLAKSNAQAVASGDETIQVKSETGQLVTLKIDPASGAIVSLIAPEADGKVVENFSDWRDAGGIKAPFKTEVLHDGKTSETSSASNIKINSNLKAEDLSKRP